MGLTLKLHTVFHELVLRFNILKRVNIITKRGALNNLHRTINLLTIFLSVEVKERVKDSLRAIKLNKFNMLRLQLAKRKLVFNFLMSLAKTLSSSGYSRSKFGETRLEIHPYDTETTSNWKWHLKLSGFIAAQLLFGFVKTEI